MRNYNKATSWGWDYYGGDKNFYRGGKGYHGGKGYKGSYHGGKGYKGSYHGGKGNAGAASSSSGSGTSSGVTVSCSFGHVVFFWKCFGMVMKISF